MNRISVGQTIGRGYRFLFRRFFAVLGLSWLPALALGVAGYFWLLHFASDVALLEKNAGGVRLYWLALDALELVVAVSFFGAAIAVPATREALGLHDETVFAHFVVGRREMRLFLALLRYTVLIASAAVLLAFALGFAARFATPFLTAKLGAAQWRGVPLALLATGAASVVTIATLAFLLLRLGFFLLPIAAIEERARMTRAWTLSRRNFWRVLVVTLALALPLDILVRGIEYGWYGAELSKVFAAAFAARDPGLLVQWLASHAAVFAAIGATALTLLITLFAGASAMAYRTLMPAGDIQPEPVWQPASHERVDHAPDFLPVPAMAAPPLDMSLATHQSFAAHDHAEAANDQPALPQAVETAALSPVPEPEPQAPAAPEPIALEPVAPEQDAAVAHAAAPEDAPAADTDALPAHPDEVHGPEHDPVVSLEPAIVHHAPIPDDAAPKEGALHVASDADAPATTDAATTGHTAASEPAAHQASAEPVPETDVVENVLPTGDPEVKPEARELEMVA